MKSRNVLHKQSEQTRSVCIYVNDPRGVRSKIEIVCRGRARGVKGLNIIIGTVVLSVVTVQPI